ncbi:hypothetical protein ACNKHO_24670 [Shigella flexneri]
MATTAGFHGQSCAWPLFLPVLRCALRLWAGARGRRAGAEGYFVILLLFKQGNRELKRGPPQCRLQSGWGTVRCRNVS